MSRRPAEPAELRPVGVIGAALDLGSGRRGVDMGPSAIRYAQLGERIAALGYPVHDHGNISTGMVEALDEGDVTARYWSAIRRTCEDLADHVAEVVSDGEMPLVLGGDHSIAVGTVSGLSRHYQKQGKKIGLIWIDAHADMNTPETSPSGNIHGMPLACCIGLEPKELSHLYGYAPKVEARNVAIIGLRSVDAAERLTVQRNGVRVYTMRDVDERGMRAIMQEAIEVATNGTEGFHLSYDMDSVDPQEAPGVGTPVKGGLTYREAHLVMEVICDCDCMLGLEMVEVNPVIDRENRTAILATELVMSALGKRIM
jgi:arginase